MSKSVSHNKFSILYESDFEDEDEIMIEPTKVEIGLEFVNSKPLIKRFNKYNNYKKKSLIKVNKKCYVHNEMDNLPQDITEAINKKQNLTLKQILVLMNLHGIPGLVFNVIHDNLQTQVKRKHLKIFHDSRIFYVSQYNWYDLNRIEMMINQILE